MLHPSAVSHDAAHNANARHRRDPKAGAESCCAPCVKVASARAEAERARLVSLRKTSKREAPPLVAPQDPTRVCKKGKIDDVLQILLMRPLFLRPLDALCQSADFAFTPSLVLYTVQKAEAITKQLLKQALLSELAPQTHPSRGWGSLRSLVENGLGTWKTSGAARV